MEYFESQLEQIFSNTLWTHKIQEKQADIYLKRYNALEFIRILISAMITSGIVASIFTDETWVKIITAVISAINLFINTYFKSYDLKNMHRQHKNTALLMLELREDIIMLYAKIKVNSINQEIIEKDLSEIKKRYFDICKNSLDASERAVKMARRELEDNSDSEYNALKISSYLPIKRIKEEGKEIKKC